MKDTVKDIGIMLIILLLDAALVSLLWIGRSGIKQFIVNIGPEILRPPMDFRDSDLYRLMGEGGIIIKGEIVDIKDDSSLIMRNKSYNSVISIRTIVYDRNVDNKFLYRDIGTVRVYMESYDSDCLVGRNGIFLVKKLKNSEYELCNKGIIELKTGRAKVSGSIFPSSGRWTLPKGDLSLDDICYYTCDYFRAMYLHWVCLLVLNLFIIDLLISFGLTVKKSRKSE